MVQQKVEEAPKRNPNLLFGIAGNAKGFNYDIPFEYAVEGMHATSAIREVILKNLSNEINELRFDLGSDYNKYEAEISKAVEANSELVREYAAGNKTFEELKDELLKGEPDPAKEKVLKIMMLSMTSDIMLASTRGKAEDQAYRQDLEGVLNNSDGVSTFMPLMIKMANKARDEGLSNYEIFVFMMALAKTYSFKVGLPSMMLKVAAVFSDTLKASDAVVAVTDALALGASTVLCGVSAICCLSIAYRLNGVRKKLNIEREVRADILNEFMQKLGGEYKDARELSTTERKTLITQLLETDLDKFLETAPDKMSKEVLELKEKDPARYEMFKKMAELKKKDPALFYQMQAKLLENKNLILSRKSKRKDLRVTLGISVVTLGLSILAVAFPPAAIAATIGIVAISVGKFLYNILKRNKANKKKMKAATKAALDANHKNINNKLKLIIEKANKLYPSIQKEFAALKERFDKGQITSKELLEEYRKLIGEHKPKALEALQKKEAELSSLIDTMKEDGYPTDKLEDDLTKVQQQLKEVSQLDSYLQSLEAESQALDDPRNYKLKPFIESANKLYPGAQKEFAALKERFDKGQITSKTLLEEYRKLIEKQDIAGLDPDKVMQLNSDLKSLEAESEALDDTGFDEVTLEDAGNVQYARGFIKANESVFKVLEGHGVDTKALKERILKGGLGPEAMTKALKNETKKLPFAARMKCKVKSASSEQQALYTMQDEGKYQAAFLREAKGLLNTLETMNVDTKALKEGLEKGTISSDEVISKFQTAIAESGLSKGIQQEFMAQVKEAHEQAMHVTKFNKRTAASAEPSPLETPQAPDYRETASVSSELQYALSEHSDEFEAILKEEMLKEEMQEEEMQEEERVVSNDSMDSVGYPLSTADSAAIDRLMEWQDSYKAAFMQEAASSLALLETMHVDTAALRQGLKDGSIDSDNLVSEFEAAVAKSGLSQGGQKQFMETVEMAHEKAKMVADEKTADVSNDSPLSEVPSELADELVLDDVDQEAGAGVRAAML